MTTKTIETQVEHAIFNSILHDSIEKLPWSQEAAEALLVQCDDHVENGDVVEFWGTSDSDDPSKRGEKNDWRVHLVRHAAQD